MPIPYGIAAYSFGYLTGWMGKGTPHENPRPLDVHGLMDLAEGSGLGGVEFPPHMVPDKSDAGFDALGAELRSRGLTPVFDGSNVLDPALPEWVEAAHRVGSPTVRVVLSGILCGDRSPMAGKWQEHLENAVWALRAAEPTARKLGISIAVENHQDADSRDLVWICEQVGSPHVGVNLDAGNALSVGEDPIEFAQRIAPYLKNVHLKDYLMFPTESGYRLVRCAVGDGVLDWRALFALFDREAPEATRNIELGAMKDRHIRLLEPSWWEHFPPRDARTLLGPMRLLMTQGQPADAEYRVPYDRGESLAVQEAYERDQFERSVRYLKSVTES
ncbi:sugar phosphate isomerase/epimerase [Candidatus Poribacteria bacterium]|nr:sugar phosphate isomerase/epimerase [Candidatus Poribacteria bacterium]